MFIIRLTLQRLRPAILHQTLSRLDKLFMAAKLGGNVKGLRCYQDLNEMVFGRCDGISDPVIGPSLAIEPGRQVPHLQQHQQEVVLDSGAFGPQTQ